MRHKYSTRGIILARTPLGEANGLITLLTEDLGLVRARAQGIRKPGAKLASALVTYAESEVALVRGREGWRVTGATLSEPWFARLQKRSVRERAGRVAGLVLRLVPGESAEPQFFSLMINFFRALVEQNELEHDSAECLAALSLLSTLGLDADPTIVHTPSFEPEILAHVGAHRRDYILRINRGIEASGL